jgi:hypothetical protein
MRKLFAALGLSTAIMASAALPLASVAGAAMTYSGDAVGVLQHQLAPVEKAQFFFGGRNYCWYDSGWQGPGWYWCGYAWNNGVGWGGGYGWHGWRGGHGGGARRGGAYRGGMHGHGGHAGGGMHRGHGGGKRH